MIDALIRWIESRGVKTDQLQLRHDEQFGYGLFPRSPIREIDSVLLSVPSSLFLRPREERTDLTGFEQLISILLGETNDPYVEFLRCVSPVPSWRRRATNDERFPSWIERPMRKHREKFQRSREKFPNSSDEQFQWAFYSVNTRCVHLQLHSSSKDPDDNLCLIPYFDFVNHSLTPNTRSVFNKETQAYEIRLLRPIESTNEEITFLYNDHSNLELFIEYGFVLSNNPFNQLDIRQELKSLLTAEQYELLRFYDYWNTLELYPGDVDLSWTIVKALQLVVDPEHWSPFDDPPFSLIRHSVKELLDRLRTKLAEEFSQWTTKDFSAEKEMFFCDFSLIINTLNDCHALLPPSEDKGEAR